MDLEAAKGDNGGKLGVTKGVILRQIRCRFLSLFAARFWVALFSQRLR
jgi:hypothetical protein